MFHCPSLTTLQKCWGVKLNVMWTHILLQHIPSLSLSLGRDHSFIGKKTFIEFSSRSSLMANKGTINMWCSANSIYLCEEPLSVPFPTIFKSWMEIISFKTSSGNFIFGWGKKSLETDTEFCCHPPSESAGLSFLTRLKFSWCTTVLWPQWNIGEVACFGNRDCSGKYRWKATQCVSHKSLQWWNTIFFFLSVEVFRFFFEIKTDRL